MAAGPGAFIKQNLGDVGKVGGVIIGATAIAQMASGESKIKAIGNAIKEAILWTASWNLTLSRLFVSFGSGIRSVLAGTGSIEAALRKLSSMQELQKVFTPLAGGAEAAKVKVAALVNLAASKHLNFENVANAAKNMHILSDGAAGSVEDLNRLASVSKVTGISIGELGNAVGSLSIDSLKNMGAISATAAASLEQLQQNGGSTSQVMNQLASALDAVAASGKGAEDSLAGVEAKYASVVEQMKTAVGSPWIAGDIQNTKNYADALQAVTPALKEVSSAFYIVFGGLATAKSEFVKWVSESGIAQVALKMLAGAVALLVSGLTVLGSVKLFFWLKEGTLAFNNIQLSASRAGLGIQRLTGSMMLANAAATATTIGMNLLNVAMKAMGFLVLLSLVASVYGAIKNWSDGNKEAAKEAEGVVDATRQMNAALQEQIDKIDSIVTRQAALRAALKESTDSWEAYYAALAEGKDISIVEALKKKADAAGEKAKDAANAPIGREVAAAAREDSDTEARKRSKYDRDMATATPEEQKELMGAEGARRSALGKKGGEEAKKHEDTAAKLSEIDIEIDKEKLGASDADRSRKAAIVMNRNLDKDSVWPTDAKKNIAALTAQGEAAEIASKARLDELNAKRIAAGKGETGLGFTLDTGLLSEADAHLQEISYAESRSNKHLGGAYTDMSKEDRIKAKEKWGRQKAEAQRLQGSYLQYESEGASMTQQSGLAGKAITEADKIAEVNAQIAQSKQTGYELAQEELVAQSALLGIEMQRLNLSAAQRKELESKVGLIGKQLAALDRAHETEKRQTAANLEASGIRGNDFSVEQQKDKIERDRLVAELKQAQGVGNQEGIDKAWTAVRAHDASRANKNVAQFQAEEGITNESIELSMKQRGDKKGLITKQDEMGFKEKFDSMRGVLGDDKAKHTALSQMEDIITLKAHDSFMNAQGNVTAQSLTRIGGGGGVGTGGDSMIDLTNRIKELHERGNNYLKKISERKDAAIPP